MVLKRKASVMSVLFGAATIVALTFGGAPARAQEYVKSGVLTCSVSGGVGLIITSSKALSCTFQPDFSGPEHYTGTIHKYGLDIGVTSGSVIVWAVLSSISGYPVGALAGNYGGVSAEASVVVGVGANALLGGSNKAFALQPLSVQGQVGLNIAAGITSLELVYAP